MEDTDRNIVLRDKPEDYLDFMTWSRLADLSEAHEARRLKRIAAVRTGMHRGDSGPFGAG
jgi:hypothetical protein